MKEKSFDMMNEEELVEIACYAWYSINTTNKSRNYKKAAMCYGYNHTISQNQTKHK